MPATRQGNGANAIPVGEEVTTLVDLFFAAADVIPRRSRIIEVLGIGRLERIVIAAALICAARLERLPDVLGQ